MEIDRYIENGKIRRSRIATDISRGKLEYDDIKRLIAIPQISSAFIGTKYENKKPKEEWNKGYLELVSYAASSESFNEDYLFYLWEVSKYVNDREIVKKRRIRIAVGVGVFVVIVIVIILIIHGSKTSAEKIVDISLLQEGNNTKL